MSVLSQKATWTWALPGWGFTASFHHIRPLLIVGENSWCTEISGTQACFIMAHSPILHSCTPRKPVLLLPLLMSIMEEPQAVDSEWPLFPLHQDFPKDLITPTWNWWKVELTFLMSASTKAIYHSMLCQRWVFRYFLSSEGSVQEHGVPSSRQSSQADYVNFFLTLLIGHMAIAWNWARWEQIHTEGLQAPWRALSM